MILDSDLNGVYRTNRDTSAASTAGFINGIAPIRGRDGIHKADTLQAYSTRDALIVDGDLKPWHSAHRATDLVGDIWKDLPNTAAGTAVAYR